jgi:hypothetical protein
VPSAEIADKGITESMWEGADDFISKYGEEGLGIVGRSMIVHQISFGSRANFQPPILRASKHQILMHPVPIPNFRL